MARDASDRPKMSERQLRASIPVTPDTDLRPNRLRQVSGWRRQQVVSELRGRTAQFARSSAPPEPLAGEVVVEVVVWWEKRRQTQDFDGLVGSLKPLFDGLADAGWYRDDAQIVGVIARQERDPDGQGFTVVTAMEAEARRLSEGGHER